MEDRGQGWVRSLGHKQGHCGLSGGKRCLRTRLFLEEGEPVGLAGNISHLVFHSNSLLLFLFFKIQKAGVGGLLARRRDARLFPTHAALASLPASSPASPVPLSGSRAAAHMVSCQILGSSGEHVWRSWQICQPRVTMETASNGRPVLPAGAGPSVARTGGRGRAGRGPRGQKTEGGARSHPLEPGQSTVPGMLSLFCTAQFCEHLDSVCLALLGFSFPLSIRSRF